MMQRLSGGEGAADTAATKNAAGEPAPQDSGSFTSVQLCGLTKLRDILPHERRRHTRNEALNTLIEFGQFFLGAKRYRLGPSPDDSMTYLLRDISLEIPAGCVVGVVDLGGASRHALLKIIAGMSAPHGGKLLRRGRVVGLKQLMSLAAPDRTCRENLLLLGNLFGLESARLEGVLAEIGSTSGLTEALERPLRRCARGEFLDLAISFVCLLEFDIVIADEINRTVSEQVTEQWNEYISSAPERGQTLFISSRRLPPVFDLSTHLLLLEKGRLRAFGPTSTVLVEHDAFIEEALVTPLTDFGDNERLQEDEEGGGGEEDDMSLIDDDLPLPNEDWKPRGRRGPAHTKADSAQKATQPSPSPDSGPGDFAYITRESALCKVVPVIGNLAFHPDGSPMTPAAHDSGIAAITQQLPLVFREDGMLIRFSLLVLAPNVVLRPGIELMRSKKIPALRLVAPEDLSVEQPCSLTVEVFVPPNLLEKIPYTLSSLVVSFSGDHPEPEFTILKNYMTFAVTSREEAAAVEAPVRNQGVPFPLLRKPHQLEARKVRADNFLTLADDWQMQVADTSSEDAQPLEPNDGSSVAPELSLGQVLVQDDLELAGWIDFRANRSIVLRCEFDPPIVLEAGLHDLSTRFPSELLPPRDYSMDISIRGRNAAGRTTECHGTRELALVEPVVEAEEKTLRMWAELPPARASVEGVWKFTVEPEAEMKEAGNDR